MSLQSLSGRSASRFTHLQAGSPQVGAQVGDGPSAGESFGAPASAALGVCLRVCHTLQRADAVVADLVASSELRNLLHTCELQHARLAFELEDHLGAGFLAQDPTTEDGPSPDGGFGDEDVSAFWVFRKPSAAAVLEHRLRGEAALLQSYRRALAVGLGDDALAALLARQAATVRAICASLRARLRTELEGEALKRV